MLPMKKQPDFERAAALQRLLNTPDEPGLARRGRKQTQTGSRDRWQKTWMPAQRAWVQTRLSESEGLIEGWRTATATASTKTVNIFPMVVYR